MTLPGGPANKSGNLYEKLWTVRQLLDLIDGQIDSIRIESPGIDKAEFVVRRGNRREFHQTKCVAPSGSWSPASLSREGVIQAIKALLSNEDTWFVFASGSGAPALRALCHAATKAESSEEFTSKFLKADKHCSAFKKIRQDWQCDVTTAIGYLRRVDIRTIDDRGLKEQIKSLARVLFLTDPRSVLAELMVVAENSIHRTLRRDDLVETMRGRNFYLRRVTNPEQAVGATRQVTYSYLQAARKKLIHRELLPRKASEEVQKRIGKPATVIVGKAGSGKTACTVEVVDRLLGQGLQVLAFRLDWHVSASNTKALGQHLGLEESPLLVLAAAAKISGNAGVLVVDQLDVVSTMSGRSSEALDLVENLLEEAEAMRAGVNIHVVLVCRSFDWKNDHRLRRLIQEPDAQVPVGEFTDDETKQLLSKRKFKPSLFSERQIRLLKNPQNLSLFLNAEFDRDSVPAFDTVKELFDQYWRDKRILVESRTSLDHWKKVLQLLCTEMTKKQELFVRKETLDCVPLSYLQQMASEGVLAFDGKRYGFGHESFFDYCYARVSFLPGSESLTSMLCASEQHLFRRGQVRQVLVYIRDADPDRYIEEVQKLLADLRIRAHIKDLVFALLADVPNPRKDEWKVWKETTRYALGAIKRGVTNNDKMSGLAWNRLFFSRPWFTFPASRDVVEKWLNSNNDNLTNMAVNYLTFHQRHSPDTVAMLLEPHKNSTGDWPRRLKSFAVCADLSGSRRLFKLFLHLIDNGTLDTARGSVAMNSTFWDMILGLEKKRPEWVGEVLAHQVRRQLAILEGRGDVLGYGRLLGNPPGVAEIFIEAAEAAPCAFVEHVLPVVLEVSDSTARGDAPPRPDAVWPYPIKRAHPGAEEGCLDALARAVAKLAEKAEVEQCAEVIPKLRLRNTCVANHLLLALYRGAPKLFADEMVAVVCAEPWRFKCGFSDNPYWYAMETISAVTTNCTRESLNLLEDAILGYVPRFEASADGKQSRGWSQFALLTAIPTELRSERAQKRFQELKRKFGEPPGKPKATKAERLGSPISPEESEKMTDEQWLKAMRKYSSGKPSYRDERSVGGVYELSQSLEANVKKEPGRFARLALRFETDMNPAYMQRTLTGLSGVELDGELKLDVCRKAFSEFRESCGMQIAGAVGSVSDRLPDDAVGMIDWLATEYPDPQQEQWQEDTPSGNKCWDEEAIYCCGINTVRGCAAIAILRLILSDSTNWPRFRGTVERMLEDRSAAVLSCVAGVVGAVAVSDPRAAMALFLRMNVPTERLLATRHAFKFMKYSLADGFEELRPVIEKMILSGEKDVGKKGSILAGLAMLHGHDAEGLVDKSLGSGNAQRLGIAKVTSANIKVRECPKWCERKLIELFEDEDAEVRQEAAACFSQWEGEPFEEYENLVDKFSSSKAFGDDPSLILRALEQSRQRLPGMTCTVCERFLQRFSEEAQDVRHARFRDAYSTLEKLVFRTYQQHQKDKWGSHALDLIDQLCLERLSGTVEQFELFER